MPNRRLHPEPGRRIWSPVLPGVGAALVVTLVVHVVAAILGHLFGFHPGHAGLVAGLAGGFFAGLYLWAREDSTQLRDYELVAAGQRRLCTDAERSQLSRAHQAATTVAKLWPEIRASEATANVRLRGALWGLSGTLQARGEYAETLSKLQAARVGVPAHTSTARQLAEQIKRAEALHRKHDAEAHRGLEQLTVLAQRCEQFSNEQAAIRRAKSASLQAYAVLGPVPAAPENPVDERRAYEAQLDAIHEAYNALPEAPELPAGTGIRVSASVFYLSRGAWTARKLKRI